MDRTYIEETVNAALIAEFELEPEAVVPDARIREDLKLDSLDIVDMVVLLEETFSFTIEDRSPVLGIRTMNDIYDYIERLQAGIMKTA